MGQFAVGQVVLVIFPFSDLSGGKLRPALVLANAEFNNLILCQITSKPYSSKTAIKVSSTDFSQGGLPVESYVRPDKIFTADPTIIKSSVGKLKQEKIRDIVMSVKGLFC